MFAANDGRVETSFAGADFEAPRGNGLLFRVRQIALQMNRTGGHFER